MSDAPMPNNDLEMVAQLMDQTHTIAGLLDVVFLSDDLNQAQKDVLKAIKSHMDLLMLVVQRSIEENLRVAEQMHTLLDRIEVMLNAHEK